LFYGASDDQFWLWSKHGELDVLNLRLRSFNGVDWSPVKQYCECFLFSVFLFSSSSSKHSGGMS
jgi:hypothetical protein